MELLFFIGVFGFFGSDVRLVFVCDFGLMSGRCVLYMVEPLSDLGGFLWRRIVLFSNIVVFSNSPHVFSGEWLVPVIVLAHFALEDLCCLWTNGLK